MKYLIKVEGRGAGSVFKLEGGHGQDSMACNYLQLIEYEKLIEYLSSEAPPCPDEHYVCTRKVVSSRSVCEGQLFAGTSRKTSRIDTFALKFGKNKKITTKIE